MIYLKKRRLIALGLMASGAALSRPVQAAEQDPLPPAAASSALSGTATTAVPFPTVEEGNKTLGVTEQKMLPNQRITGIANPSCDLLNSPRSVACVGGYEGTKPSNRVERAVMGAATIFATDHDQMISDPRAWAQNKATYWALAAGNSTINQALKKIPFFAQTTIGLNWDSRAEPSLYLDSFMKLATLGKDGVGDPKGIVFSQVRYSGALNIDGSTLNAGLGARYRIGDDAMVGINGFWDYRIVNYTTPYSRFGVGLEAFWKDFEMHTNGYISGSQTHILSDTSTSTTYERVVPGWDLELAYRLPDYPQLAFFVKGFVWDYYSRTDNTGVGGGANWQMNPHMNLEASVSNEVPAYLTTAPSTNNDSVYASIKFKYTFQPVVFGRRDYKKTMLTGMTQPVRRRYDVLLEQYSKNKSVGTLTVTISGV
jgi:hypothetical protein